MKIYMKRMNMTFQNNSSQDTTPSSTIEDNPFDSNLSFVLYLEPIYNSILQVYQNVITLNCDPAGSLSDMVTHINLSKLSRFQQSTLTLMGLIVFLFF